MLLLSEPQTSPGQAASGCLPRKKPELAGDTRQWIEDDSAEKRPIALGSYLPGIPFSR